MTKKIINIDLEFDNITFDENDINRVTKNYKIGQANIKRKGKKLEFTPEGKLAHAENSRRTSRIRKYNKTTYLGTCKNTGKQLKLDIHGLREHGFNPANVNRVVHGHKKSHKGYYWSVLKIEQTIKGEKK